MIPGDRVHFPGDSHDRGTVLDDDGTLIVVWDHTENCAGRGQCGCSVEPADVDGRDAGYVAVPAAESTRARRIARATARLRGQR